MAYAPTAMAEVLLFHHALGLTEGVRALADDLRAAGHTVHTPDLYEGRTFADLEEGVAHAEQLGFDTVVQRGVEAADGRPPDLVYMGLSLGVMPAHRLAHVRPGAKGAVFLHSAVPRWPEGLPLQVHVMEDDDWGDVDIARRLPAELFLYPGDRHLFTDRTTADYDPGAADLVRDRVLAFLARVG